MSPSSKIAWFWPTLTATVSAPVCCSIRASSCSARAGTFASSVPSSGASQRRLLDAQAVGVGGDHAQLLPGGGDQDAGQHGARLIA